MEYNKSNLYAQADKYKQSGWKQVGADMGCDECYEEIVTLPGIVDDGMVMEIPESGNTSTQCGYCITPGMSYTPDTRFSQTYEPETGFHRGTVFPELDYPFLGEGGKAK